jgi:predicted permease
MRDLIAHSLRHGVRAVRHSPGSSLVIVTTLAAAIAAGVAVFGVLHATLLQPLPLRDADRVFFIRHAYADGNAAASPPLLIDHRTRTQSFESISAAMPWNAALTGAGDPERLRGMQVSADFFSTFGVDAAVGRVFRADEDQPGRERVLVISDGLWERRFGRAAGAIGAVMQLNGEPYEVIGVMPPTFQWGRAYGRDGVSELWAPFALTPVRLAENQRGNEFLDVYARLRTGGSVAQAQAELDKELLDLRARYAGRYTAASGFSLRLVPVREEAIGHFRQLLVAVFVAVVSLLLVAATNVAGLLIARATGRAREMSVHAALGAGRARLVAQNFGEAAVLAASAGALGLGAAWLAVSALDRVDRVTLPRFYPIAIDAGVAGFAVALIALVAVLAGLLPSWQAFRHDLSSALRISPLNAGGHTSRAGRLLIVAQTAMTLALLVGAGLIVRSLGKLDQVESGFRRDVFSAQVQLPALRYPDQQARLRFANQLLERVATGPEPSAGIVSDLPLSGSSNSSSFDIEGRIVPPEEKQPHAETWSANPTYFRTLGIPLKKGRFFDDGDVRDRPAVAIVSEAFAERYFPGEDAIGKRVDFEGNEKTRRWREIVGVVGNVRDRRIELSSEPQLYAPYAQRSTGGLFLVVRGGADPMSAQAAMRAAVQDIDPALPVYNLATMASLRDKDTRDRRIAGVALTGFAVGALLVAVLGLYGLVAQSVRHRVREIGVRVAVGARPSTVLRLFLLEGGLLMAWGVLAGVLLAIPATRMLSSLVFGVTTTDPWTYTTVATLLLCVGVATSAIPAWRAARIDPTEALRIT